ncbi:MAG: restriction endonuclease subunit S [Azoarcus sp.]|nr:restriction endonuclease subunit S [Azoarcus sp.]
MSIPNIDIRPDHWQIVRDILRKHVPQYEVWAFGSRAKWTAKQYSDLDLAIITNRPLPLEVSASLSDDFSESDLPWKVDVVDWASTSESFRKIVERDKVRVQKAGMAAEWPSVRLGNYIDSSLGKMLDAKKNKGTLQPYLGNSNVRWGQFDLADLAQMKFEPHEADRYGIRYDDLIICEGGEPGRCAIWREELPGMKIQKALHRVRTKAGLSSYYLFYWFMLAGRTGQLEPYFTGTTIKHLTGKTLAELKIPLPPSNVQEAIAEILGALDDRIDNLRQTNATLEAIAAALFKSWFVDFDGIAAENIVGATHASPLHIPKGWRVGSFDEAIEILGGGTPKTSVAEYWDGDIPWFSVADAPANGQVFVLDTEKKITELGLNNCSAKLLPEMTVIISARGTVGKVALTGVPMAMNQSCYALRPKQQSGEVFVYFSTLRLVEHLQRIAHGAVFDTITRDSFKQITTYLPTDETIADFSKLTNPLLERIRANSQQAATLATLRDTLLPHLISGRLRVRNREQHEEHP